MDDQQKDQEVFRQNLNEKGSFQTLFQIYLLFTQKGTRHDGKEVQKVLLSKFENFNGNNVDLMQRNQLWDCPEKDEILSNCKYKIFFSKHLYYNPFITYFF